MFVEKNLEALKVNISKQLNEGRPTQDWSVAFYDKKKNVKICIDKEKDVWKDEEITELYIYIKPLAEKRTIIDRKVGFQRVLKKVNGVLEYVEIDEKEFFEDAYKRYLDYKSGKIDIGNKEQKLIAEQQKEIEELKKQLEIQNKNKNNIKRGSGQKPDATSTDLNLENVGDDQDDSTDNLPKHRKTS